MKPKHSSASSRIPLRVILFPEQAGGNDAWVAQCMEIDLVAQGKSIHSAQESFCRVLEGHIALSEHLGMDPFDGVAQQKPTSKRRAHRPTGRRSIPRPEVDFKTLAAV